MMKLMGTGNSKSTFGVYALSLALLLALPMPNWAREGNSLVWRTQPNTVDAQIEAWDLKILLSKISAATGWQIYLQPGTRKTISVRFKNLTAGEALGRLLGDLNFALLPQPNAPPKLLIYRTSLQEATQLVSLNPEARPPSPRLIPNELIVTLKPDAAEGIEELARKLGGKVAGKLDGLNSYRLQFQDDQAANAARESLAKDPNLGGIDSNYLVERPTRTENLEVEATPSFSLRPKATADGKVIVGLIDTPVQPLQGVMNDFLLPSIHVAGEPLIAPDQLSHGTSMAETVLHGLSMTSEPDGDSPVRILPIDVYGPNPETTTFDVAKGIVAAVNSGATIINLSLGGDGQSDLLARLIREGRRQGVMFFGAAGNFPSTEPVFPAAYPEVVAVTAGDRRGNIAPYANRGSFVDVVAPGISLVDFNGISYLVSGTSASTAYVSGTAAALRGAGKSPEQVEALIRQTLAVKPGDKR